MWNPNIEKVCLNISSKCEYYKKMHDKATDFYYNLDNIISITSIIIITGTGTTSFATLSISDDLSIKIIIGVILYITAVMEGIKKFINPSEKNILHSNAMKAYSNLYHNIQKQLILETENRQSGKDYVGWITREFDNLSTSTPDIPSFITNKLKEPDDIPLETIITVKDNTHSEDNKHSEDNSLSENEFKKEDLEQIKDKYTFSRFNNLIAS